MNFNLADCTNASHIGSYQNIIAAAIASATAIYYNIKKNNHDTDIFKRELFIKYNELYRSRFSRQLEQVFLQEHHIEMYKNHPDSDGLGLEEKWDNYCADEPYKQPEWIENIETYLNICSEQHYWYKKKLVDKVVWKSWLQNMRSNYKGSFHIQKILKRNVASGVAYYTDDFWNLFKDIPPYFAKKE